MKAMPPPQDPEVSDVPVNNDDDNTSYGDGSDNDRSGTKVINGNEMEDVTFHRATREIMNQAG